VVCAISAAAFLPLSIPAWASDKAPSAPLKIGFLFVGPISDSGWNYAQDEGRHYVESALRENCRK
jgi:simple sugar transport system substrate-binding protein